MVQWIAEEKAVWKTECACWPLARSGRKMMSAIRSLSGDKRTLRGSAKIDANDPEQTFDRLPTQVRAALNPWIQGEELVRKACATEAIRPLGKVGWSQRQQ
jgi:hypothetical protein